MKVKTIPVIFSNKNKYKNILKVNEQKINLQKDGKTEYKISIA